MSRIDGNRFVVIERDDQKGDAAKAKRVYSIDLDKTVAGKPLAKKLVIDLLAIGNARNLIENLAPGALFRFPVPHAGIHPGAGPQARGAS